MSLVSRAWMLDAREFHHELRELLADARAVSDLRPMRDHAARLLGASDPIVRSYLEALRITPPDDWGPVDQGAPVGDWYRLLMAEYLTPTRPFRAPDVIKRRFPELGWSPAEARRLGNGRQLQSMVDTLGATTNLAAVVPDLSLPERGWLTQDDIVGTLDRLRSLDRGSFRHRQDLVAVVEQTYEVLEAAATKPDLVLLLLAD
jgi:hypothetical protein